MYLIILTEYVHVHMQLSMQVVAEYQLEVRLDRYTNPSHKTVTGTCCDDPCCDEQCHNECDNYFIVRLLVGNGEMQREQTDVYKDNDDIRFAQVDMENTLVFYGSPHYWNVRMTL